MYGYIYLTTNLLTGKIYIGQHHAEQFSTSYIGSGTMLRKAIKKYGKQNFTVELLCECLTQEELDEKEINYIAKYNSTDKQIGYNVSLGGNSTNFSEETKQRIADIHRNRLLGTVILHKGDSEVSVKPDQIEEYLLLGYEKGRSDKARKSLSANYNYQSKGMLGKKQSDTQKARVKVACSYKRTAEQLKNFSEAKKVKNRFVCLRTPDNSSTIRCLITNKDKYLALGYLPCRDNS